MKEKIYQDMPKSVAGYQKAKDNKAMLEKNMFAFLKLQLKI